MTTLSEPLLRDMNDVKRLFDVPYYQKSVFPNDAMFVTKTKGKWEPMSTDQFLDEVNLMSRALISDGVQAGDKVAIVSPNRVEWNIMDIAIQQMGAVVVPIYPNISDADYKYIFADAEIYMAFVGTDDLYDRITALKGNFPKLKEIYAFDKSAGRKYWKDLAINADSVERSHLKELKANVRNEDLATIIYTSGTTGNPKGVMLSHNNILSNVLSCADRIPADQYSRTITFLPVCHVYERMLHYLYMYMGSSVYFAESIDALGDNLREVKPHVFTAVPRMLEKVFDKIMAAGDAQKGIKRLMFFWALGVAEKYDTVGKGAWYKMKLSIARALVFKKWQEALGGQVKAVASGSAALQPRIARIFLAAGIPVLEGYGLTETSPVISVNCLKNGIRIGTVGPLIDGVKVKFGEDGEILVKGPNVMMGYYNLPEKTAEVLDAQGWFATGDIGEMVEEKFLKITDRKKEIFKTSGGKFIIPQVMENKFKESRFIEQIIVVGEGRKFPAALIVPSFSFVKDWAKRKNIDLGDGKPETIVANEAVQKRIWEAMEKMNKQFGHWEQIKKIHLLPHEFTIESGELTPTLKYKRKIIQEKYKKEIEGIYAEGKE